MLDVGGISSRGGGDGGNEEVEIFMHHIYRIVRGVLSGKGMKA